MLVLLALSGLYLFITQQDDIGTGTYTTRRCIPVRRPEPAASTRSTCCRSPR